ncbi:MAG: hypothetical protein ACK4IS_07320 [Erythrobacter sp.]
MKKNLTWYGAAVSEKMRAAAKLGINATMAACVSQAKSNHSWQNQTGILEGSIKITAFARAAGNSVIGQWGSADVKYALIHELGGVIRPVRAKALAFRLADGSFRMAQQVTIPARPFLRPAADALYPLLADKIRKAFDGGAAA